MYLIPGSQFVGTRQRNRRIEKNKTKTKQNKINLKKGARCKMIMSRGP